MSISYGDSLPNPASDPDNAWYRQPGVVEEAYKLLITRSPTEIVNIWRTATRIGDVHTNADTAIEEILGRAVDLLRTRNPELYRAVHIVGVRDHHPTLQDMCADELGGGLSHRADREVEQLFIGLLTHDDYEVRRTSFDYLYVSLQSVPRNISDALELAQQLAPYVEQFRDS